MRQTTSTARPSRPEPDSSSARRGSACPARRFWTSTRAAVRPRLRARGLRGARDLLHLDVHRSGGQAVPGFRHDGDAAAVFLLSDAAVRVLHHPDCRPSRDARHRRLDDEEQRAHRDEGLRHQPVPRCRAARSPGGVGERRAVRAAGSRAGSRQQGSGAVERDHSRVAGARVDHAEPLDGERVGRHLSLRFLRERDGRVLALHPLSARPAHLAAERGDVRRQRQAIRIAGVSQARVALAKGLGSNADFGPDSGGDQDGGDVSAVCGSCAPARAAGLFRDGGSRPGQDDVRSTVGVYLCS